MAEAPLLEVTDICKTFGARPRFGSSVRGAVEEVKALDRVSLSVPAHQTVALVGESGSGKSTLARVIMRLIEPDSGSVRFDGEELLAMDRRALRAVRQRIQMVFQDPYSSLNPRRTVGSAIAEPGHVHGIVDRRREAAFVTELLERVGLSEQMADRLPRELSGGQRQRVAIARALAVNPDILIADEAVSALDVTVQAQILNLFETLRCELGFTMLFISHQLQVVAHISDRVAVMYQGRIVEVGPPEELFGSPGHPYTLGLIEAQPGRKRGAPHAPPRFAGTSPAELMTVGCSYRDRCPLATEECRDIQPPLVEVTPGHKVACHHASQTMMHACPPQKVSTS
jgi:oligopeptide transport system ATP-binding protein